MVGIGCRIEGEVLIEDLAVFFLEQQHETVGLCGNVGDGLTGECQRRIVVIRAGMLDKEQGRGYRQIGFAADDMAVEEGLQVIVAMTGDVGGVENGIDVRKVFLSMESRFIVNHAYAFKTGLRVGNLIETVYDAANLHILSIKCDRLLKAQDLERGMAAVSLEELTHISDDDFTVDDL